MIHWAVRSVSSGCWQRIKHFWATDVYSFLTLYYERLSVPAVRPSRVFQETVFEWRLGTISSKIFQVCFTIYLPICTPDNMDFVFSVISSSLCSQQYHFSQWKIFADFLILLSFPLKGNVDTQQYSIRKSISVLKSVITNFISFVLQVSKIQPAVFLKRQPLLCYVHSKWGPHTFLLPGILHCSSNT